MTKGKRLSKEERRAEIMESASKLILEKGFSNMTMEDVIAGTTLSKGGVYHYYKSTEEIFKDLMLEGIDYRKQIIQKNLEQIKDDSDIDFFAKQMVERIIDDNPYMRMYVEFLVQKKRNPKLNLVWEELKEKTVEKYSDISEMSNNVFSSKNLDFATDFFNAIILSSEILDARENFRANKHILESMVVVLLQKIKEENDGSIQKTF